MKLSISSSRSLSHRLPRKSATYFRNYILNYSNNIHQHSSNNNIKCNNTSLIFNVGDGDGMRHYHSSELKLKFADDLKTFKSHRNSSPNNNLSKPNITTNTSSITSNTSNATTTSTSIKSKSNLRTSGVFVRKEISHEENLLNIQQMKLQIEEQLKKSRKLQQEAVDKNQLEKSRRELGKDLEYVRELLASNEQEKAGVFLLNRIMAPGNNVLCDEMLNFSLVFVQSLLQGWAFKTKEWSEWIEKLKEIEVSKLLNEIIQKINPERFGMPEKSTEIQQMDLKKAVHSILTSDYSDLIAKSSIIDLEIQKAFLLFFTNVVNENVHPNITLSKELFSGYCYTIMLNEPLMTTDNNTEKTVLLKMLNNAQALFQKAHLNNNVFDDIGTGIPLNLKSCMNLCQIILNSDGKNEKTIEITKSQLFELQKTDPNNPYITYFNIITLEKRVKFLLTKDVTKNQVKTKLEDSLTQCINLCNLLEKMLKRYSVRKTSSYSFMPIALRLASIHSLHIDYYSKSRDTLPKVQESAAAIIEQLNSLQEIFTNCPPRITSNLITQSIFLRMRANFYLRNHAATAETFNILFSIRHLCEFDPYIVNSTSFYLAGRTVTKSASDAIPYLQELESEHPESLDMKLLLINAKDFALENSIVTKDLIINVTENYRGLQAQIEKEKPKNADALLHKIKTRLTFLENLLGSSTTNILR
ncbi:predicted protein [Naegleria gruberi]|uniref:Predicted protein n=1 Tax=Naegleria gruberi TaxID=5762 RepID=D2VMZ8_NAEGR|nr:uncharacterized protein NAEGRDRAFT_50892 [Naegleria gruberi]EFC41909.1 predicted protein [Naegleria gruberi]|eukprot:XP_002674653.1 predicted protein [Naegleria gruberi strain NEG-M]